MLKFNNTFDSMNPRSEFFDDRNLLRMFPSINNNSIRPHLFPLDSLPPQAPPAEPAPPRPAEPQPVPTTNFAKKNRSLISD